MRNKCGRINEGPLHILYMQLSTGRTLAQGIHITDCCSGQCLFSMSSISSYFNVSLGIFQMTLTTSFIREWEEKVTFVTWHLRMSETS